MLRLVVFNAVRIDRYGFYYLVAQGLVVIIHVDFRNFVDNVHSVYNLTERGVLPVEMRGVRMHNEKLRTSAVRHHGTSHGNNASLMFKVVFKSVFGKLAPYRISGTAGAVPLDRKSVV